MNVKLPSLYRCLIRDIGKEFAVSRNLGESRLTALCRSILCVWFLLKAFRIGVSSMFHEQLGSRVLYRGRRCFVSNWAGSAFPSIADGRGFYERNVPRAKIRNVINLRELWHRFDFGVTFYTGSHMGNDINRILYWRLYRGNV